MKPVELIRNCLRNSTPARGAVFEPFCGSGSTIIACEEMGYKARAIELEPAYADVAVARWQNLTGKQATLDGHGATFEHVREGRRMGMQDALKEEAYERSEQGRQTAVPADRS